MPVRCPRDTSDASLTPGDLSKLGAADRAKASRPSSELCVLDYVLTSSSLERKRKISEKIKT
jgi:hypothetical protein